MHISKQLATDIFLFFYIYGLSNGSSMDNEMVEVRCELGLLLNPLYLL
jgi:hypothetical protein